MHWYKRINNIFEEKLGSNLRIARKQRPTCRWEIFFDVRINAFRYINAYGEQGEIFELKIRRVKLAVMVIVS